jgi:HD-GYP domain-containing protein (c-di-GMP phosphodiesterase class II)
MRHPARNGRSMLVALARVVETRHPWMRGHSDRVTDLALSVARFLGWAQRQLELVRLGGLLHACLCVWAAQATIAV